MEVIVGFKMVITDVFSNYMEVAVINSTKIEVIIIILIILTLIIIITTYINKTISAHLMKITFHTTKLKVMKLEEISKICPPQSLTHWHHHLLSFNQNSFILKSILNMWQQQKKKKKMKITTILQIIYLQLTSLPTINLRRIKKLKNNKKRT